MSADAQWERAHQTWALWVLDPATAPVVKACRRILRLKRFEVAALESTLPGVVRRGAHLDLAPLESGLRDAGVSCELRRSEPT